MRIYQGREIGGKCEEGHRLENASRHRCVADVLSTLHNTALVVNSMTFEQNAAVSPYDRASRRGTILPYTLLPHPPSLPPALSLSRRIISLALSIVSTRTRAYLSSAVTRNELHCSNGTINIDGKFAPSRG